MFFFRRKSKQPPPPWLIWLMIGMVVYVMVASQFKGTPQQPNRVRESLEKVTDSLDPKRVFNPETYRNRLLPAYTSTLGIKDLKAGVGLPAVCGQQVKITYQAFLGDGKEITDKITGETFRIGSGKVMPALDEGVIGMQQDGTRSVMAAPKMSYGLEPYKREDVPADKPVRFEITLLSIEPPLPDPSVPFRIFDKKVGAGSEITCGKPVKAQLTVWDIAGKKLFSTHDEGKEPISFTPGHSDMFLGIEQGALGMYIGGVRTLLVPPPFQQTLTGEAPSVAISLPRQQTVLVEIEALP